MSSSKDPDIRKLYLASSAGNVNSDEIVEQAKAARDENVKKTGERATKETNHPIYMVRVFKTQETEHHY